MASTADFKNGMCIHFKNGLYFIVEFQHVKPGKGPAFVRTKLKNVQTGKVIDNTFTAGVKIDVARIERRPYQFLYKDDMGYNIMHTETYEQMAIQEEMIPNPGLLKEGDALELVVHADTETPLLADMQPSVDMEVTYTEPGLRGDTSSTNSLKPATVETGATVMVPLFINTGDIIKVDTATNAYKERVKA
ncbi:MAG: elongation factor P [Flavobacteriaceae bacterium]|nr:elongation factor P [Flavobacteriaceae bacterium]